MLKPAIVVVAYNRPESLMRLLQSLARATYHLEDVPLLISIDYQDSAENEAVLGVAEKFEWVFGEKKIVRHNENLGLKKHVLLCGDLVNEYGAIIMLEDDLYVSRHFYRYASDALNFYKDEEQIGGISLYDHVKNFMTGLPFVTLPDSSHVYFLQIASSWGQCWSKKQWEGFRNWYSQGKMNDAKDKMPEQIAGWPESSWLKDFIAYLIDAQLYFVYPKGSFTSNFGEGGTHNKVKNVEYQVPLVYTYEFGYLPLAKSLNVYDAFFEMEPSCLNRITEKWSKIDYSVDLYGTKKEKDLSTDYVLTSKKTIRPVAGEMSFGLELKPMVLNVVEGISGNVFSMVKKENIDFGSDGFTLETPYVFNYFYTKLSLKKLMRFIFFQIKERLFLL